MSSGIIGMDMSLDELTAHINQPLKAEEEETPMAQLERAWKSNGKLGARLRRNTFHSMAIAELTNNIA